jgi:hypothetical protein
MQQSCEFKGMSHFCCLIALLPVVPFIATAKKAIMGDEGLSVASRLVARLVAPQLYRKGL